MIDSRVQGVNFDINKAIEYKDCGKKWRHPDTVMRSGSGVCHDYAICKMFKLRALGVYGFIQRVWITGTNEAHMVCMVPYRHKPIFGKAFNTFLVLDNRTNKIVRKENSKYRFVDTESNRFEYSAVMKRIEADSRAS